jgi:uncharacterized protein (PEP-CTERM system associated)
VTPPSSQPRSVARIRGRNLAVAAGAIAAFTSVVSPVALAQGVAGPALEGRSVRIQTNLRLRGTLTDNVFYSATNRETDFITEVTPGITASVNSARLKLNGTAALPAYGYLAGNADPRISPTLNGLATYEAVEKFLYVDARANVSTIYVSPLGPTAGYAGSASNNLEYLQTLAIAPYIKGQFAGEYSYLLRYENTWTDSTAPNGIRTTGTNARGRIESPPRFIQWSVDGTHTQIRYPVGADFENNILRARLTWRPDQQVSVFGIGGHESFTTLAGTGTGSATSPTSSSVMSSSAVYGAGATWNPTPRTSLNATWEERFYGPSYLAGLNHRRSMSSWRLNYSRQSSFFPTEALRIGAGDIASQLDTLFSQTISDPFERQLAVQNLLSQLGSPTQIGNAQVFYAPRVTLVERLEATVGAIGRRNSLFFTLFASSTESLFPIADSLPVDIFSAFNQVRGRGFTLAGNHRLTPLTNLSLTCTISRSQGVNSSAGIPSTNSTNTTLFGSYNVTLGPKTIGTVGLRVSQFESSGGTLATTTTIDERAIIVGLDHRF